MSTWAWIGVVVYVLGVLVNLGMAAALRAEIKKVGKSPVRGVIIALLWPVMVPHTIGKVFGAWAAKEIKAQEEGK